MSDADILTILKHDLKVETSSCLLLIDYIIKDIEEQKHDNIKSQLNLLEITFQNLKTKIDNMMKDLN